MRNETVACSKLLRHFIFSFNFDSSLITCLLIVGPVRLTAHTSQHWKATMGHSARSHIHLEPSGLPTCNCCNGLLYVHTHIHSISETGLFMLPLVGVE